MENHESLVPGSFVETTIEARVLPPVDVLVVGAGPAGVTATIAAARNGATVLLAERSGIIGGMMTAGNAGLTNFIVHQKDPNVQRELLAELEENPQRVRIVGGLPLEIAERLLAEGAAVGTAGTVGSYVFTSPVRFRRLLLDLLEEAGAMLLFHAFVVDAVLDKGTVRGCVIETKEGRRLVPAKVVIDASGDADVAVRSGCPAVVGIGPDDAAGRRDPTKIGVMSAMGVMYRVGNVDLGRCLSFLREHPEHFRRQALALYELDDVCERFARGEMVTFLVRNRRFWLQVYNSPDPGVVTLCCPCVSGNGLRDVDIACGELAMRNLVREQFDDVRGLPGFEESFLLDVPPICVRETRRIVGEYVLTAEDVLSGRDFPDSIGRGAHTVDAGDVPEDIRNRPVPRYWCFHIPYRCLLPRNVENLLVAGRCASMTHEAFGCTRTTVQCMVMGEAGGTAAALAVQTGCTPRALPPAVLQARLREQGVLL